MENNKIIEFKNSNVIFSEKNLDMISSLIEDYGDVLDKNKDYTKLSLEFLELNDFFNDQLSPEDKKVFERLMSLNMDLRNYLRIRFCITKLVFKYSYLFISV